MVWFGERPIISPATLGGGLQPAPVQLCLLLALELCLLLALEGSQVRGNDAYNDRAIFYHLVCFLDLRHSQIDSNSVIFLSKHRV